MTTTAATAFVSDGVTTEYVDARTHAIPTAASDRVAECRSSSALDAGHAFLFQHYEDFAREILEFLR